MKVLKKYNRIIHLVYMYRIILTFLLTIILAIPAYSQVLPIEGTNLQGGTGAGDGGGIGGLRGQDGGLLFIRVLGTYDGSGGVIDVSGEKGLDGEVHFAGN